MKRRNFGALICASALVSGAWAQDNYPSRSISLVVPYGAGGVTDVVARALALGMGKHLGQPVVIENKPGAGSSMGVMDMRTAKPDGYRLTLTPVTIFRQPHIQKVQYDPVRDLNYIAAFMTYDFVLAVPQDSPFKTVQDLVEYAKKNPDGIDYGTPGKFTANHVVMALLGQATGARFTHAPFKGDAEALNALMAGHIKSGVYANTVLPYLSSGKLRALASASETRPEAFANVPTFREAGYAFDVPSPLGIAGPRNLPPEIVRKLEAAVKAAMDEPAFRQVVANYGVRTQFRTSQEYTAFAKKAFEDEKKIVQNIGLED